MKFGYKSLLIVMILCICSFSGFSENEDLEEKEPEKDTITFSGNNMKTIVARGKERTFLSGNAVLNTKENDISADSIELYGKDFNFVLCSGNIHVINKDKNIEVWSEKLFYNRSEKMIRFQENAVMEDRDNEIVVKGGLIETWEETEVTIIQIGVRILKKDMICRSEFARYLRDEERLELSGMPRVIRGGDEYRALKIFIDLKNDEIHLEGNVKGEVFWEEEAEEGETTDTANTEENTDDPEDDSEKPPEEDDDTNDETSEENLPFSDGTSDLGD